MKAVHTTVGRAVAVVLAAVLTASLAPIVGPAGLLPEADAALSGLPAGFTDDTIVKGLLYPTTIAFAPDSRIFVALKSGKVQIVQDGVTLPTPFIDIGDRVHDNHDRGLLGLAIHPEFPKKPYVYLLYTYDPPGVTPDDPGIVGRVSQLLRVEADPATGYATAKPGSEKVLLGTNSTRENIGSETDGRNTKFASCMTGKTMAGAPVNDCIASDENSHSVGSVAFAPDGSLFVSDGDGSNYGGVDPRALRAQMVDSLNGKVLRIDPMTGAGLPDNPFFDGDGSHNRSKVWALGLRNPFRIAVSPFAVQAYVGDVGWNTWEEINTGKGANFGWPCYEGGAAGGAVEGASTVSLQQGSYRTNTQTAASCATLYAKGLEAVQAPVYAYSHNGTGASANAGAVYPGGTYPASYKGALFFADYNRRFIKVMRFDSTGAATVSPFAVDDGSTGPVQLVVGPDTNLYWLRYGGGGTGGEIRRIRYVAGGNTPPSVVVGGTPTVGQVPLAVTFSSVGSHDPDGQGLSYRWDFKDGATSTEANPKHTFTKSGVYDVSLTVTETSPPGAKSTDTVRITVGTTPPLATIVSPANNTTYAIGDVLRFSGKGVADGKPLPASALSWEIRQGHNQHFHYATPASSASPTDPNLSLMTLVPDDHGDETYYQVCLTARASADVSDTQCIDLKPRKTAYTVATSPVGMTVQYEDEGEALIGPAIINPIVNSVQTLSVDPIQQSRTFVRWSDGNTSRSRTFTVGTAPTTFTAVFENRSPTAVIKASATSGAAPLSVGFDARDSSDPEGDALSYLWYDGKGGGTSPSATPTFNYPLPGTYPVKLVVTDKLGATSTVIKNIVVTGQANPVPAPWTSASVGTVTTEGSASFSSGTFTISNAGTGITGVADAFRFVSQPRTGDFIFVARVDAMDNTGTYAKAGLMARESLAAGARHVMFAQTPVAIDGAKLIQRTATNGGTTNVDWSTTSIPPRWLRLVRTGDMFTAAQSVDGKTWVTVGRTTLDLPDRIDVGLAVGSQNPGALNTGRFSQVAWA